MNSPRSVASGSCVRYGKGQKHRRADRYGCERAVKEVAVIFGQSLHINFL